jgi:hypothetical protein
VLVRKQCFYHSSSQAGLICIFLSTSLVTYGTHTGGWNVESAMNMSCLGPFKRKAGIIINYNSKLALNQLSASREKNTSFAAFKRKGRTVIDYSFNISF